MIYLDDLDDHWGDDDQADAFTWIDCDNPDCNCADHAYGRPIVTVHLPAEDVTR